MYSPLFEAFVNRPRLVRVELVLENSLFLVLVLEHTHSSSLVECLLDYDKVEQDNFLSPEEIASVARDLLELLREVHAQGKVLFSIKPENIYFCSESGVTSEAEAVAPEHVQAAPEEPPRASARGVGRVLLARTGQLPPDQLVHGGGLTSASSCAARNSARPPTRSSRTTACSAGTTSGRWACCSTSVSSA